MSKDATLIEFGPCNVTYDGNDLGYFSGGVTVDYSVEWLDIPVDQLSAPVDSKVKSEKCLVTVPMVQTDLATLQALMPQATYVLDGAGAKKKMGVGGGQTASTDWKTLVVTPCSDLSGTNSTDANEKVTVFRARPNVQWKKAYNRDKERIVPVEFMGLSDITQPVGYNLVLFGDSTATA